MKRRVILTRPERKVNAFVKKEKNNSLGLNPTPPTLSPLGGGGVGGLPNREVVEKITVSDLVTQAESLSLADQKELLARISLLTQTLPASEARDSDMWATAVYQALTAVVGGGGEGMAGPLAIKRVVTVPGAWGPVRSFMAASKMNSLTVSNRQSVYMMLAKLVVENARTVSRKAGIPLSAKLVANCSSNITGIFDQSFPGYLSSGLALMVARRLTAPESL